MQCHGVPRIGAKDLVQLIRGFIEAVGVTQNGRQEQAGSKQLGLGLKDLPAQLLGPGAAAGLRVGLRLGKHLLDVWHVAPPTNAARAMSSFDPQET
jgi:hypothetical protein